MYSFSLEEYISRGSKSPEVDNWKIVTGPGWCNCEKHVCVYYGASCLWVALLVYCVSSFAPLSFVSRGDQGISRSGIARLTFPRLPMCQVMWRSKFICKASYNTCIRPNTKFGVFVIARRMNRREWKGSMCVAGEKKRVPMWQCPSCGD